MIYSVSVGRDSSPDPKRGSYPVHSIFTQMFVLCVLRVVVDSASFSCRYLYCYHRIEGLTEEAFLYKLHKYKG